MKYELKFLSWQHLKNSESNSNDYANIFFTIFLQLFFFFLSAGLVVSFYFSSFFFTRFWLLLFLCWKKCSPYFFLFFIILFRNCEFVTKHEPQCPFQSMRWKLKEYVRNTKRIAKPFGNKKKKKSRIRTRVKIRVTSVK